MSQQNKIEAAHAQVQNALWELPDTDSAIDSLYKLRGSPALYASELSDLIGQLDSIAGQLISARDEIKELSDGKSN